MIREMKRRHPLITIGQIQMRLQRTSNRVLSKASISRILTNSIRLGKRAKRSLDGSGGGDDEQDAMGNGNDELMQLSSDENTGGPIYIDDMNDDDDDDDDDDVVVGMNEHKKTSLNNLEDFQRFMLRKTSANGDENCEQYDDSNYPITYPHFGSEEDEDDLSDENETSPVDLRSEVTSTPSAVNSSTAILNENGCWNLSTNSVKSEPVCVFVNRNYDENSSDSEHLQEQPLTIDEQTDKSTTKSNTTPPPPPPSAVAAPTPSSAGYRRGKVCPICGEKNFSRLSHHLAVAHNLDRQEILTLLTYTDQNNNKSAGTPSTTSVSDNLPADVPSHILDKSPQQTPISINTNNQQITCPSSPTSEIDQANPSNSTSISTTQDQQSANYLPIDGKKRLLCPRCETWVLNLTDHLIKKHHLSSKQERLPFLRLARNRCATPSLTPNPTEDKSSTNSFLISPDRSSPTNDQIYQNIVKKYRKKLLKPLQPSSTATTCEQNEREFNSMSPSNLLTMNSIQTLLTNGTNQFCKQENFKFPNLTEHFSAMKNTLNNYKDQQQVNSNLI